MPQKILHKLMGSEMLSADPKTLTVEHFISTEKQDEDGDIMDPESMTQRGKVVVLQQHGKDPKQGNEPIAKNLGIRPGVHPKSGNRGLIAKTQFYDGSHLTPPDNTGKRLYEKSTQGFMPNWSIGWLPGDNKGDNNPVKGGILRKNWRLHEYSLVGVGMNDEATCADEYKCKSFGMTKDEFDNAFPSGRLFTVRLEGKDVEFPDFRIDLVDGKLKIQEKDALGFYGEKDFLDSTEEVKFAVGAEMVCIGGQCELVGEGKPFPNEHSCRLLQPVKDASTRRKNSAQKHEGKSYDVIYQKQNGKWVQQAYRYSKDSWTSEQAAAHCKSHDGLFTGAKAMQKEMPTEAKIAHKVMHMAHKDMIEKMKKAACMKTEGNTSSMEDMGNDALNEYRGLVEDHVEKYIKAVQANNANPEFDEDDHGVGKGFEHARVKVHHDALKTVHAAFIKEIHACKDKADLNSRIAAKELLDQHHKEALPHAVKFMTAYGEVNREKELPKKTFSKSIEDITACRIAYSSLQVLIDGMFQEACSFCWGPQNNPKLSIPSGDVARTVLEEFIELAIPYLSAWVDEMRPEEDEAKEGEPQSEIASLKDVQEILKRKDRVEVSVDLKGMEEIIHAQVKAYTGIVPTKEQIELQVKSLFDKFRLTFPSGDRRTKTSDDDIYKKALEGVSFKIGTK